MAWSGSGGSTGCWTSTMPTTLTPATTSCEMACPCCPGSTTSGCGQAMARTWSMAAQASPCSWRRRVFGTHRRLAASCCSRWTAGYWSWRTSWRLRPASSSAATPWAGSRETPDPRCSLHWRTWTRARAGSMRAPEVRASYGSAPGSGGTADDRCQSRRAGRRPSPERPSVGSRASLDPDLQENRALHRGRRCPRDP